MNEKFVFSFSNYKKLFVDAQNHDYEILTIKEYIKKKYNIIYLLTHPDFYFSDYVYED